MPKLFSLSEQHRSTAGNHTAWLDSQQGNQTLQNERIHQLSRQAGDLNKQGNAHLVLQMLAFLSLISNTTMTPVNQRIYTKKDEYGVDSNEQALSHYQPGILPVLQLMQETLVRPPGDRLVKRHINTGSTRSNVNELVKNGSLSVLVKNDFHMDVDENIYKLAVLKGTPQEIASVKRMIKQNRLREKNPYFDNDVDELVKMFDEYLLYKSALNKLEPMLSRKSLKILFYEKSSALYALANDAVKEQRLELKVQLYHLEKLAQGKFVVDYCPFMLTANPKNSEGSTYEAVEAELAGLLIEKVIGDTPAVPAQHTITYGPAYQARKSIIAYALYKSGIHSPQQLAKKITKSNLASYKQLIRYLQPYLEGEDNTLLNEVANHFYFSLYHYYQASSDVNLAISDSAVKKISAFNQQNKIDALFYYFNNDIEVKYKPKKDVSELAFYIAQEFLLSRTPGHARAHTRPATSKKKYQGPTKNNEKSSGHVRVNKIGIYKKGAQQRIKKPKRKDFSTEEDYQRQKLKYEKYIKERVALNSSYDRERRRTIAIEKIKKLEKVHQHKVIQISSGGFTLSTALGDQGGVVVLNAHAWFDKYTNQLKIPAKKHIHFLGPDGKVLLEAPELNDLLPTSYLVAGDKYPGIYSTFTAEGVKILMTREQPPLTYENVRNYRLKYYGTTPDEEIKLAIIENRIKGQYQKMDFLNVDELAGEKKLSDVLNLMKKDKLLENYDSLLFYACREDKTAGQLTPAGLNGGDAYEIQFSDIPISEQVRMKRSLPDAAPDGVITFDGYYVIKRYEVWNDYMIDYLEGIIPYRN